MIHLALSIASFLFLAGVAITVFGSLILAINSLDKSGSPKKIATVQRCPQPCLKHNSCLPEIKMNKSNETAVKVPIAPWDQASEPCLCGVPDCRGHEIINGEIHIPNHPTLGHVILSRNLSPKAGA
jgi:hypothetical protein